MNEYELLSEIDDNIKKLLMVKKKASKQFRQLKKFRKDVLKLCRKNSKIPERLEIFAANKEEKVGITLSY